MSLIKIKSLYGNLNLYEFNVLPVYGDIFDVLGTTTDRTWKKGARAALLKHSYKLWKTLQGLFKFNMNQLCTHEPQPSPDDNFVIFENFRDIEQELSDSSWKFTHDLTLAISTISDSSKLCKNKVISTYSLQSAIGILLLGSKGETREQILDNVFPSFADTGSNKRNIHPHNAQMWLAARIDAGLMGKENQFNVANRLYIQKKYEIVSQFKNDTGSCYAANATNVDFSKPNTRDEINEWVKEKTNDKITELLPGGSLGDDTRAVLVNALHFLGSWEYTFSANLTKKANFMQIESFRRINSI